MHRKLLSATILAIALVALVTAGTAQADNSWTGEVIDHVCFMKQGAHGPDHAACAEKCIKEGGEVGLLTADGDVFILKADPDHGDAFDALKEMAAKQAVVTGELSEADGDMIITVTKVEAAMTN